MIKIFGPLLVVSRLREFPRVVIMVIALGGPSWAGVPQEILTSTDSNSGDARRSPREERGTPTQRGSSRSRRVTRLDPDRETRMQYRRKKNLSSHSL